jgi:hypothetical protein
MTTPRRRILRFPGNSQPTPARRRQPSALKVRASLEADRAALARWMTRLRRAFHAVEKLQQRITRNERQLQRREET